MAIELVNSTQKEQSSGTSIVGTVPSGTGGLLVAVVTHSMTTRIIPPAPSGWTLVASATTNTTATGVYTAPGSAASYSWAVSSGRSTLFLMRWSGVDPTTPIDVTPTSIGTGVVTSVTAPTLTTTKAGVELLHIATVNASTSATADIPVGVTALQVTVSTGRRTVTGRETRAAAGVTDSRTWNLNPSTSPLQMTAFQVPLRPLGGGAEGPVTPTVTSRVVGVDGRVKVRTAAAASVRLKVGTDAAVTTGVVYTSAKAPDGDGFSDHQATGLASGVYYYRVAVTDTGSTETLDTLTTVGRLMIAPTGQTSFSWCFSSCTNSADSTAMAAIAARGDAFFAHRGDLWYADASGTSLANFRSKMDAKIIAPNHAKVFATMPVVYAPSDHDATMNNNGNVSTDATAMGNFNAAYRERFPTPTLPTGGVYYSFMWGRVLFINLDCRSFASSPANTDNSSKTLLGATQKQWVKNQLSGTSTKVAILLGDAPWVSAASAGDDAWAGYTTERAELGAFFGTVSVKVAYVGGDMHALAANDGSSSAGGIPSFQASPLNQNSSVKGGPWTAGPYPSSGSSVVEQYGRMVVTDSGSSMSLAFTGYTADNVARVSYTYTVATSSAPPLEAVAALEKDVPGPIGIAGYTATPRTPETGDQVLYVDSTSSAGTATGTQAAPFKTLAALNAVTLLPGAVVYFKRGTTITGGLLVPENGTQAKPITFTAYGTGNRPVIDGGASATNAAEFTGTWLDAVDLDFRNGTFASVRLDGDDCSARGCTARDSVTGVQISGARSRLLGSSVINNNKMSVNTQTPTNDDSGAFGVLLEAGADDCEIGWNNISGHLAASYDYSYDGCAVEIYGGKRNLIHHNLAADNETFSELGSPNTADNYFFRNVITGSYVNAKLLVTRGSGDTFGPVLGTHFWHNSAYLPGANAEGIIAYANAGENIIEVLNNAIQVGGTWAYTDDGIKDERNNVFKNWVKNGVDSTSLEGTDPQFYAPPLNLQPATGSPVLSRDAGAYDVAYTAAIVAASVAMGSVASAAAAGTAARPVAMTASSASSASAAVAAQRPAGAIATSVSSLSASASSAVNTAAVLASVSLVTSTSAAAGVAAATLATTGTATLGASAARVAAGILAATSSLAGTAAVLRPAAVVAESRSSISAAASTVARAAAVAGTATAASADATARRASIATLASAVSVTAAGDPSRGTAAALGTVTSLVISAGSGASSPPNLLAAYAFAETNDATTIADATGNDHSGTLTAGITFVDGPISVVPGSRAIRFSGTGQRARIERVGLEPLGATGGVTTMFWYYLPAVGPVSAIGTGSLVKQRGNDSTRHGIYLNPTSDGGQAIARWHDWLVIENVPYTRGTWSHFCMADGPSEWAIYVDGSLINSGTRPYGLEDNYWENYPWTIGATADYLAESNVDMRVSMPRIFAGVLSQSDVQAYRLQNVASASGPGVTVAASAAATLASTSSLSAAATARTAATGTVTMASISGLNAGATSVAAVAAAGATTTALVGSASVLRSAAVTLSTSLTMTAAGTGTGASIVLTSTTSELRATGTALQLGTVTAATTTALVASGAGTRPALALLRTTTKLTSTTVAVRAAAALISVQTTLTASGGASARGATLLSTSVALTVLSTRLLRTAGLLSSTTGLTASGNVIDRSPFYTWRVGTRQVTAVYMGAAQLYGLAAL